MEESEFSRTIIVLPIFFVFCEMSYLIIILLQHIILGLVNGFCYPGANWYLMEEVSKNQIK